MPAISARVPRIKLQIGDMRKVFGNQATKGCDRDYLLSKNWSDYNNETVELQPDLGIVTLKGSKYPLNTVILNNKIIEQDTVNKSKETIYNLLGNHLPTDFLTSTKNITSSTSEYNTCFRKIIRRYINYTGDNNIVYSGYISGVDSDSAFENIIPEKSYNVIRIGQCNSNPDTYIIGGFETTAPLIGNPNINIEISKAKSPTASFEVPIGNLSYPDEKGAHLLNDSALKLSAQAFTITLMSDKEEAERLYIHFQVGQNPVIRKGDDSFLEINKKETISDDKFNSKEGFTIQIRSYSTVGKLVIESSLFKNRWIINNSNDSKALVITSGKCAFTFLGMGQFNFGFSNVLFFPVTGAFSESNYSGYINSKKITEDFDIENITLKVPSWVNKLGKTSTSVKRFPVSGSDREYYVSIYLYTSSSFLTPYISSLNILINPDYELPIADMSNIGVEKLDINWSIENTYKIKKNGSITFTHKKVYLGGNASADPTQVLWESNDIQYAIKIWFAWDYYDGTSEDDLNWESLFAGFMRSPKIDHPTFGESTATYQLVDRWQQLADSKIIDSKYYGGVTFIKAVKDMCKIAGLNDGTDVEFSTQVTEESYVLPKNPNDLHNPKFKFKFGTSCEDGIKQIQDCIQYISYFDNAGILQIKRFQEIINDSQPVIFADYYMEAGTCDDNLSYPGGTDLIPPWNSIKSPNFERDTNVIKNHVIIFGPNFDNDMATRPGRMTQAVDKDSIDNPDASNYIGYHKIHSDGKIFYTNEQDRVYYAYKTLARVSHPAENYKWETFANVLGPYTPVKIKENYIKTGIDESINYWLVGNSFSFNAKDMSAISQMEIKTLRGLSLI